VTEPVRDGPPFTFTSADLPAARAALLRSIGVFAVSVPLVIVAITTIVIVLSFLMRADVLSWPGACPTRLADQAQTEAIRQKLVAAGRPDLFAPQGRTRVVCSDLEDLCAFASAGALLAAFAIALGGRRSGPSVIALAARLWKIGLPVAPRLGPLLGRAARGMCLSLLFAVLLLVGRLDVEALPWAYVASASAGTGAAFAAYAATQLAVIAAVLDFRARHAAVRQAQEGST
jgi:hypothetical protein